HRGPRNLHAAVARRDGRLARPYAQRPAGWQRRRRARHAYCGRDRRPGRGRRLRLHAHWTEARKLAVPRHGRAARPGHNALEEPPRKGGVTMEHEHLVEPIPWKTGTPGAVPALDAVENEQEDRKNGRSEAGPSIPQPFRPSALPVL